VDWLKGIGGKIAAGAVALAVVAGAISWFQMPSAQRDAILSNVGRAGAWLGVVLLLPWATFFVIGRIARLESNAAGAGLVFAYTAAEAGLLAWLFGFTGGGPTGWTLFAAAVLLAGVYNLLACDWIAEKVA